MPEPIMTSGKEGKRSAALPMIGPARMIVAGLMVASSATFSHGGIRPYAGA
jgi:hypothetical protein